MKQGPRQVWLAVDADGFIVRGLIAIDPYNPPSLPPVQGGRWECYWRRDPDPNEPKMEEVGPA